MDGGTCKSCAHAGATRIFLALMMNGEIGVDGGLLQTIDERGFRIASFLGAGTEDHVTHGINSHPAGDVTSECATHTVGNDEHQTFLAKFKI